MHGLEPEHVIAQVVVSVRLIGGCFQFLLGLASRAGETNPALQEVLVKIFRAENQTEALVKRVD